MFLVNVLSDYQINLLGDTPLGKEEKLLLTLFDKKKYVIHHSILKEYIKLGMKVKKVLVAFPTKPHFMSDRHDVT